MSIANFELNATQRTSSGKLASRRLRNKQNFIPAIVYGGKSVNSLISIDHNQLLKISEQEKFYSQIINLNIDGSKQKVVLKDLQRHPFKPKIVHLDFQRVQETDVITMHVPLHFIGASKCPGVKLGGLINHHVNSIEVRCQAQFLPEFIEVNLSTLELGQIIHISDLQLPSNVDAHVGKSGNIAIVSVHVPKAIEEAPVVTEATTAATTEEQDPKDGKAATKDNKDKTSAPAGKATTTGNTKQDKK